MAYMRCRFLAVESLSLTRNLVVAPERWLRDIGFHWVAPIIPSYVRDYPNSFGDSSWQTRGSKYRLAFNLRKVQKGEAWKQKKYAYAKRGIWTNVREIMVHLYLEVPENIPMTHEYMTHHLIIVFIIVVAIVFTWCVFWLFGTFLTEKINNNPYIEIWSN